MGEGDPYDAIFAIRMNDDSYSAGRFSAFTAEVEAGTSINAQPLVHSPGNAYLQMLALEQPYTDLLGEKPVNQEEIHAQSGFRRNKTGGSPPPSSTMSA
ncbi:MAG TPA: hypothetical protein DIT13_06560 [Verrucomicrobiales bacterium]|nr:hypothetical protein [Verrucomicrobiales bacterium]